MSKDPEIIAKELLLLLFKNIKDCKSWGYISTYTSDDDYIVENIAVEITNIMMRDPTFKKSGCWVIFVTTMNSSIKFKITGSVEL